MSQLEEVRRYWWSLTDDHRAEIREEFMRRMATDDAFSRTTAIMLELQDENRVLRAALDWIADHEHPELVRRALEATR